MVLKNTINTNDSKNVLLIGKRKTLLFKIAPKILMKLCQLIKINMEFDLLDTDGRSRCLQLWNQYSKA